MQSHSSSPSPPRTQSLATRVLALAWVLILGFSTSPLSAQSSVPLYTLHPVKADLDDAGYTIQRIAEQFEIYLDSTLLADNPGRLTLDLPDGSSVEATRSRWTRVNDDVFSWYGVLSPEADLRNNRADTRSSRGGQDPPEGSVLAEGYVLLSSTEGRVMGTLQTPSGTHYHITPAAGGIHRLVRTEASQHHSCGVEAVQKQVQPVITTAKTTQPSCSIPTTQYRLDVLALYMPDFVGPDEQAVRDSINMDIAVANTIFANSQVKITYNLVYAGPLTEGHPHSSGTSVTTGLSWLNAGQPEVERLRADYGADVVSLMIPPNSDSVCGIANLPHKTNGVENQFNEASFIDEAFMVYEEGCGMKDHTYAHEFGHTLGMQHDRGDRYVSPTPIEEYAFGYVFESVDATGRLRKASTVMGCATDGTEEGVCSRIPYFSNPNLSPAPFNTPIGETATNLDGAFNACIANERAQDYSNFKESDSNAVPNVQITSPSANATVPLSTPITLAANASDPESGNLGAWIQWRSDKQGNLGTGSQISVQLTSPGDHLLTASVQDGGGKIAQHTIRVTVVESDPPLQYLERPRHNETLSGNFAARGWATDASGVASVTFKIDNTPVTLGGFVYGTYRADVCNYHSQLGDPNCPWIGWSGNLDTTAFSNGQHTLHVTATDTNGNSTVFSRPIQISNTTTASFAVTADAFVNQNAATANYGTSSQLYARSASSNNGRSTYLKFNVSGVTGPVQSAKLRIHTGSVTFPSSRLYWISSNSWTESSITWQNAPVGFYSQWSVGYLPANSWVEFDVSSIVTGNGTYTIGITASDTAGLWFYSRETQFVPSLVVTY